MVHSTEHSSFSHHHQLLTKAGDEGTGRAGENDEEIVARVSRGKIRMAFRLPSGGLRADGRFH